VIRASVNAGKQRSALRIKSLTRGEQATLIQLGSLLAEQLLMYRISRLEDANLQTLPLWPSRRAHVLQVRTVTNFDKPLSLGKMTHVLHISQDDT